MPISKIIDRVKNHKLVLDQCVTFPGLELALTAAGIPWRRFAPEALDEYIEANMNPDETLLTRDMEFFRRLGPSRAILLPINNGHKKRRLGVNMRLKKQLIKLTAKGEIEFRLMRGMRMLFTVKTGHGEWVPI